MQYAKVTARFSSIAVPGVVTTFITMSGRKDELDVEIVGGDTSHYQSNVFYKGVAETGVHGGVHAVTGGVGTTHEYTIDWNSKRVIWSVDNTTSRTYNNDALAVSPRTPPGERWYPATPSQAQISVWDFGGGSWAGGPIPWGSNTKLTAAYEWIDVQCYDDQDQPVAKWPANSPDRKENTGTGNGGGNGNGGTGGNGGGNGGNGTVPGNSGLRDLPSLALLTLASATLLLI
jgi:beta-glucanase (GH16 family)